MQFGQKEIPASRSIPGKLYVDGQISIGLVLPVRTRDEREVDYTSQLEIAVLAEASGLDAIWVRDVPLNGDWYPEPFGHLDPFVMLGAIAAMTSRIMIGTAAIVLPLRHPLHVAKSAASLQSLSSGRFILGVGSGDREEEYAAFGKEISERRTLFRAHWERVASALLPEPWVIPDLPARGIDYTLRPSTRIPVPMIAVGSGGQTLGWIAEHAGGWATYHREPEAQKDRYGLWRQAVARAAPDGFRSFSQAMRIELLADRKATVQPIELGYSTGIGGLVELVQALRDAGVHHVMLNLVPTGRSVEEQIIELGDGLLSQLQSGAALSG